MTDLPQTAMGVLKLFSTTKQGIEMFAGQLINGVKNGNINALELKAYLKAIETIAEQVNRATKDEQLTEAELYGEKVFHKFGYEIKIGEVGTKYNYDACGDTEYERRKTDMLAAKRLVEERMTFLKALKEPLVLVDDNTGEVVKVNPPVKTSTTGLIFTPK